MSPYSCPCEKSYPDVEYLRSLYPQTIFPIYEIVSDYCDRMEYEGSMMFDDFPDKETVLRLADEIVAAIPNPLPETTDGNTYLKELVLVLLVNEFLHRRLRKREF